MLPTSHIIIKLQWHTGVYEETFDVTAVSDNTLPALSKTFQDFGFFFDVNQNVTMAPNPCLSNKDDDNEQKLQKINGWRERTDSFSPLHMCISSGLGSSIRNNFTLGI